MATYAEKTHLGSATRSAKQDVRLELQAMDAAFKRISKSKADAIRFLSKAGILTKTGRLAKKYR